MSMQRKKDKPSTALTEIVNALDLPKRLKYESLNLFNTIQEEPQIIDNNGYIHGKTGTGKTIYALHLLIHKALALYPKAGRREDQEFLKNYFFEDFGFAFVNVPKLFLTLRSKISNREDIAPLINKYSNIDYLILDDIGIEKATEFVMESLYLIIDNRYNEFKPTLITSNHTLDELVSKIGDDRIVSRIADMCETIIQKTKVYRKRG